MLIKLTVTKEAMLVYDINNNYYSKMEEDLIYHTKTYIMLVFVMHSYVDTLIHTSTQIEHHYHCLIDYFSQLPG